MFQKEEIIPILALVLMCVLSQAMGLTSPSHHQMLLALIPAWYLLEKKATMEFGQSL